MIEATTISTKGQLTIPSHIRDQLQLEPGTKVRFLVDDDGSLILFPIKGKVSDLYGSSRQEGQKPLSIDDMNEAVAQAAADRALSHDRS
jgi:AbrB family looped-hinge helix DNA binding protein